jgi:G3E family GTPase
MAHAKEEQREFCVSQKKNNSHNNKQMERDNHDDQMNRNQRGQERDNTASNSFPQAPPQQHQHLQAQDAARTEASNFYARLMAEYDDERFTQMLAQINDRRLESACRMHRTLTIISGDMRVRSMIEVQASRDMIQLWYAAQRAQLLQEDQARLDLAMHAQGFTRSLRDGTFPPQRPAPSI